MAADIVVILIIAGFAIFGYKKGLVRSVVGILSLAASIALAWILYPVVADLLVTFGVDTLLFENIQSMIGGVIGGDTELQALPEVIKAAAESGRNGLIDSAAGAATQIVLNIIAFLSVLILSRIIIWIGIRVLNILSKLPVIGFFNRAGGLLIGALQGAIVVYIVLAIVYAAVPLRNSPDINKAMESSALAGKMYQENPIINIFVNNQNGE